MNVFVVTFDTNDPELAQVVGVATTLARAQELAAEDTERNLDWIEDGLIATNEDDSEWYMIHERNVVS
jgi:hypothetical protein